MSDRATSCAWASTSRMRLLERTKEWPPSSAISLGSPTLLVVNQQMLGDGDFKRVVDEWLEHDAAGAKAGEDFVVRHLGGGGQDQDGNFGPGGANRREQAAWNGRCHPTRAAPGWAVHGFQIAQERLLFGEKAQVIERRKGPLQVVQDPDIGLEDKQAGPGSLRLIFRGREGLSRHKLTPLRRRRSCRCLII